MFQWLADNWPGIAIACFIISEILPFIKSIKSDGILQAIVNFFKKLSERS